MAIPSINNARVLDIGRLPSLPHVLLKLMQACYKADVSFGEIADILKMDTALSTRIVAVGNSPLYAQWNGVKDFNRLLIALGINTVRNIAVTAAVHRFFSQIDEDLDNCLNSFWRSSLTCAHTAKALARLTGYPSEDEAFLTGLIHKVGQLALLNYAAVSYTGVLMGATSEQTLAQAERERFGTTSPEVGAMLVGNWGLDSFVGDALLYQYEPAEAVHDASPLVKLINLSHKLGERGWYDGSIGREADLLFGLGQAMLEDMLSEVEERVTQTARALEIPLKPMVGKDGEHIQSGSLQVEAALTRRVHDVVLLDGTRQQLLDGKDMDAVLQTVMQNLRLLFSLPYGIAFLYSESDNRLSSTAWCATHKERGCEFQIPLEAERSLVADSLLRGERRSSFDPEVAESLTVVDRQMIRVLGDEGMICLPLIAEGERAGVLVVGLERGKQEILDEQGDLLGYFCAEAARGILRIQSVIDEQREMFGTECAETIKRTRMLLHEANNPLGIINNYLEVLSMQLKEEHAAQEQITVLKEEIERVGKILLRVGKQERDDTAAQGGRVDLNATIRDLVSLFQTSIFRTHGITAELDLDTALQPLSIRRNKLKQILTNLLKNAAEAMPEGGGISIGTKGQVNVDGKPFVELTVSDNGPGIPGSIMQNLFSPVRSGKGKEHSGLGLTIVKNLVTELSGTISCSSSGERGTEFRILLPVN